MTTRRLSVPLVLMAVCLVIGSAAQAEAPAYVGVKKCKRCHLKQFKSWEKTRMAMSFELLKPGARSEEKAKAGLEPDKDYAADPQCLGCHTTGYGKPGGFKSLAETPDLVGVQCESCHGPGSEYLKEGRMTNKSKEFKTADLVPHGLVIPEASTCTSLCHNEKSPFTEAGAVFDYAKRKDEGTHEHYPLKHPH